MDVNTLTHFVAESCVNGFNGCVQFFTSPDVSVEAKVLTSIFALWAAHEAGSFVKNEKEIWKSRKNKRSKGSVLETGIK